jgi:hypothetical protein
VQVFQEQGDFAHPVNVFGVKRRFEKLTVERYGAGRQRRLLAPRGKISQRRDQN